MAEKLNQLETEQCNPNTKHIDEATTVEMITMINNEDKKVAIAVEQQIPQIAKAVDCIHEQMLIGGRLIYIGAGTSGRLGVLDASECPPTFGVDSTLVQGIVAGGNIALTQALENVEDSTEAAVEALRNINLKKEDVVCGLASSGKTPFVMSGLTYANSIGCKTISISCVSNAVISSYADYPIEVITGAEAITGSTRLKAGTAQKMILNMLSTASMVKLGKVYGNLMVDVQANNDKLKERAKNIVMQSVECDETTALELLKQTNYSVKQSIIMGITGLTKDESIQILQQNNENISSAIKKVKK